MTTITFDELKERLDEVFDRITRGGELVAVTHEGTVVTLHVAESEATPAHGGMAGEAGNHPTSTRDEPDPFIRAWDRIAALIERDCPEPMSAVEAIREQRRG